MAIKVQGTTVIDDSRNIENIGSANLTSLSIGGTAVTASATELNYVDGVTSPLQTQLDSIDPDPTKATLTKSFANNEIFSISLSSAVSVAPNVSVLKEVPQVGVSTSRWDVRTAGSNYDRHDTAYATTLTFGAVGFEDIDGTSYDSVSFGVGSQDGFPTGIAFNTDGTKMYMVGEISQSVYQYNLSTSFDLSTASYDSISFSVATEDTDPSGIAFNTDGTKMYMVGDANDTVYQYSLSTGFDLSTASYDGVSFSVGTEATFPTAIAFNDTGTKMYTVDAEFGAVYQYTVPSSEALILGTGSFASGDVGKTIEGNGGEAILTATDGSYSLVTAFNDTSTIASGDWSMFAATFDATNGLELSGIIVGFGDIDGSSYDSVSLSVGGQDTAPYGIAFNNDGTKMYMVGLSNDSVYQYSLSTAFDLSTASYDSVSFSVATEDTNPYDITFNNDGTKMYMVGNDTSSVYQYTLSTGFDLSTASYDSVSFSVSGQDTNPNGIAFNNDGTKLYMVGNANQSVFQYSLSTAFDLSTASYDSVSFSVATEDINPLEVAFNNDGTKMYIAGAANDSIFQYSLSTAFDLSTASYDSVSFSVTTEDTIPYGIAFNTDGTKMYMVGNDNDTVYQYSLSTGFDLSTASYDSVSFSVVTEGTQLTGMAFNSDGTKMYMVGPDNDSVYQYTTEGNTTPQNRMDQT